MKTVLIFIAILMSMSVLAKNNEVLFSIANKVNASNYQISLAKGVDKLHQQSTVKVDIPELGLSEFVKKTAYVTHKNQQVWLGQGENNSTVSLLYSDYGLSGTIISKQGIWKIRTSDDNKIQLEKFEITQPKNSTDVINRNHDVNDEQSTNKLQKSSVSPSSYNSSYFQILQSEPPKGFTDSNDIRILVYYSQTALQEHPNFEDLIELDFADANQALVNSGIDASYTLAGLVMIAPPFTDNHLQDMSNRKGSFERLDELRDKYDADLVHFYGYLNFACGEAYYATDASGWVDSRYGFGVTDFNCIGSLTFAHEVGHNLGAKHDRFVEDLETIENDYAYGHVDIENEFKTIMSYNDACDEEGIYCQVITHYSNSDISYQSAPTGVSELEENSADNASLLNKTANIVANFNGVGYPYNFVASKGAYSNEVKLSWSAMPNVDGYEIRKIELDGTCPLFKDVYTVYNTVEETQVSITEGAEQVCYWVRAYKTYEHGAIHYSAPTPVEIGYSKEHDTHISDILPQHITDQTTQLTLHFSTNKIAEISVSILDSTADNWLETTVISLGNNEYQLVLNNTKSISASSVVVLDANGTKEYIPVQFSGFTNTAPVINIVDTIVVPQSGSVTVDYSIVDDEGAKGFTTHIYTSSDFILSDDGSKLTVSGSNEQFGSLGFIKFTAFDGELLTVKHVNVQVSRDVYKPPTIPTEITLFVDNNKPLTRLLPGYSIDDDDISYNVVAQPNQGSLTLDAEKNSLTYQAASNFSEDSFVLESHLSVTGDKNLPDDIYTTLVHVKRLPVLQANFQQKFFNNYSSSFLLTHRGQLWFWGEIYTDKTEWIKEPKLILEGPWVDGVLIYNAFILLNADGTLWEMKRRYSFDTSPVSNAQYYEDPVQMGTDRDWTTIHGNAGAFGNGVFLQKVDGSLWGIGSFQSFFEVGSSVELELPVQVNGLYNWVGASRHDQHTYMFLNSDGVVWSGGVGEIKSIGRVKTMGKIAPIDIPEPVTKIEGGIWRRYAQTSSGLYGWGLNLFLQPGHVDYITPTFIDDEAWSHFSVSDYNISTISLTGELYTAAVRIDLPALGRGEGASPELTKVGDDVDWLVSYSMGDAIYALKQDGSLWVAGYSNTQYKLGLGKKAESNTFEFTKLTSLPKGLLGADDTDADGLLNFADIDDDNDCIVDSLDEAPDVFDENGCLDTDNDGVINVIDLDDDNDTVIDVNDAFPLNANESLDTDNDGTGNNEDTDDDGDNVIDSLDAYPLDATLSSLPSNNTAKDDASSSGGESSGLILLVLFSYYFRKRKIII